MKKVIVFALVLIAASAYAEITSHGAGSANLKSAAIASQPTCAAGVRGAIFNIEGASGAADVFQVCLKDASNNYSWATK